MPTESTAEQVVLFKAPADSEKDRGDAYVEKLTEGGFQVINTPVLDFEFINLDRLREKIGKPADYSGVIFSSPRCVKGWKIATEEQQLGAECLEMWRKGSNFAVGEATAKLAEDAGLQVRGKESGNANALADIITKCEYTKPFLYPIGSLTNDNFRQKLKDHGVEVDDIVIYQTKPHPQLDENISNIIQKIVSPVYFLYFSPSGVNFTFPILRERNFNLNDVKFVAIGPTTEKELKEQGVDVYRTVSKPNPDAALEALKS